MMTTLLGGISPAQFLRTYWQKKPLLIRQAMPGFTGFLDRDALARLAQRDDAVSRLVIERPKKRGDSAWQLHEGPFAYFDFATLGERHWSLLVQGVEGLVPGGWELLRQFSFLPQARIDDLMVSYAVTGGSVGPHEDLYDVFLLQGAGRRRWQISQHGDHAFDAAAPIKILRHFTAEQDFVLEPGDMLYLPPGVAHYGVAMEPCLTYSIGFVAPSHDALVQNFLVYLGQRLEPLIPTDAMYEDPRRTPAKNFVALPDDMTRTVQTLLKKHIRWDGAAVEEFLGVLLTGPKPQVAFLPPARPLTAANFARRLKMRGQLSLALQSRGLSRANKFFLNGAVHDVPRKAWATFSALFTERSLRLPLTLDAASVATLYDWYRAGFVVSSALR